MDLNNACSAPTPLALRYHFPHTCLTRASYCLPAPLFCLTRTTNWFCCLLHISHYYISHTSSSYCYLLHTAACLTLLPAWHYWLFSITAYLIRLPAWYYCLILLPALCYCNITENLILLLHYYLPNTVVCPHTVTLLPAWYYCHITSSLILPSN